MVDRGRCSLVHRGRFIGSRGRGILRFSRVGNISNISTVGIIYFVVDSLKSTIRKSNRVRSTGGITISVLSSLEVSSRVVISNSIVVSIHSRFIMMSRSMMSRGMIHWLHRCWSMVYWSWSRGMVYWSRSRFVDWSRGMIYWSRCRFVDWSWSMVYWSRSGLVNRGRGMIYWSRGRCMIDRSLGMINRCFISRYSSRCIHSSLGLLISSIPMYTLGSSMRL